MDFRVRLARGLEMVDGIESGSRNPRAGVHPAAVDAQVQAARAHADASTVQTEVEAHPGMMRRERRKRRLGVNPKTDRKETQPGRLRS